MLTAWARAAVTLLVVLILQAIAAPKMAVADEAECRGEIFGCLGVAKQAKPTPRDRVVYRTKNGGESRTSSTRRSPDFNQNKAASPALTPREICRRSIDPNRCAVVTLDALPDTPAADGVPAVTIAPHQAAVMAAAYLPLKPGKPTVGPPPNLNKWKMAAVGYPLWIWAEGDLDPAPVSQSVSGLTVSLDANLAQIVYDMGDGTRITCGPGTPWRKGSAPAGTPSPDCGHTYTKPSLPKGSYTIAATTHWSVAWTAGGQSGTIPFTQTTTTTLPVGEVQALVR
jgi:hypothetical protein